ncbi:MAG TPA: flavin reductase, partial [Candidatus Sulfotelmatobacter sp.]|nr:flavin reductase [Candidatus Sulfotelmatobacter sp.]
MTERATPLTTLSPVDAERYREVMGRFVTGVTVVTSMVQTEAGAHPWGTTVNAFTSVSLDPPLVLVCI